MQSISLSRQIDAEPAALRDAILDIEPFMRAAGFDEVTVADISIEDGRATGGVIDIANSLGILRIELSLAIIAEPDALFAYEQIDGIFETMTTGYAIEADDGGASVSVWTDFELDAAYVGPIFDATIVKRQRRREIERQFEYLESTCAKGG